jgi:acetylornithine deacetylase/succinyl-diaminopimelate desuccinylase-like protein
MSLTWGEYLAANQVAFQEELMEVLRIPSVSTDPEHKPDMVAQAEWIQARLKRAGVPTADVVPTAGHPLVIGRWNVDPEKPTVLVYGHYDVQPADPLELWETPPFEPTVRDGYVYARGSADMKANLVATIQAVEALAKQHGQPPVNLIFLYEGEEEIGSSNLYTFLAEHGESIACDVVISADSGFPALDVPGFFVALKGMCGCQIDIKTGETDLHSGGYGASVPNANQVMAQLAATFHDDEGRVAVDGFYDRVLDLTDADRAEIEHALTVLKDVVEESGIYSLWGEPGYTPTERIYGRPTLDFNGLWGGFTGKGAKTVTPCEAHLKITCRLVPDQDPNEILDLIEAHVAKHLYPGVQVTVQRKQGIAFPYSIPRDNWALQRAASVMSDLYARPPVFFRVGGSVPVTAEFKRYLNADTVSLGFFQPGTPIHAPNEWFRLQDLPMAQKSYAAVIEALGE